MAESDVSAPVHRSVRLVVALTAIAAGAHVAEARLVIDEPMIHRTVDFQMLDTHPGAPGGGTATAQDAHLRGSSLVALPSGDALVMEPDSGYLLRVTGGVVKDRLRVATEAPQLVHDAKAGRAYVVDRRRDEVVVVGTTGRLAALARFDTPAEPFGIALTPDRRTLLVTTIADRALVALDVKTGKARWRTSLGPEPRGVAISRDGKRAVVTHLSSGAATWLELTTDATPRVHYPNLNRTPNANAARSFRHRRQSLVRGNAGRSFARAAFATTFVGDRLAVVPHQISTPQRATAGRENRGTYGGGGRFDLPVEHRITFVGEQASERMRAFRTAQARIGLHQPRAIRYDRTRDTLYVTGFGSDSIVAIAEASQPSIHLAWKALLPGGADGCAPTGIDVDTRGNVLVHCSFSRTVATLHTSRASSRKKSKRPPRIPHRGKQLLKSTFAASATPKITASAPLTKSRLTASVRRGRRMFHRGGDARMSSRGSMACSSCHPEGRNDGLSWRIQGMSLQTPLLTGRLVGTHPFKWDGGDKDLAVSLRSTVTRLGGRGITRAQAKDLAAFLTAIPRPRTPTITDKKAVAYGAKLFHSKAVGCAKCHSGKNLTDQKKYDLHGDMPKGVDTPSLIGLAASAPYYHDGSAATLRSLLLENGSVHNMGRIRKLTSPQVDALVAYLNTL